MWRRIIISHLKQTLPSKSNSKSKSAIVNKPFSSSLFRSFSTDAEKVFGSEVSRKKSLDVMAIATGHEREELEAELKGKDILAANFPVGPFGTKENPAFIMSYYDRRIVGCPGGDGGQYRFWFFFLAEDEHDVVWFWLGKDKPKECPVCTQYFKLKVIGKGGDPEGHDDDHHH